MLNQTCVVDLLPENISGDAGFSGGYDRGNDNFQHQSEAGSQGKHTALRGQTAHTSGKMTLLLFCWF